MKIIALLISLIFATNAIAVAPYGFKGQNQTATQYSNVLQFPNGQVTKLSGINSLVETGNQNLLLNPSFEATTATTSWTTANGSPAAETTVRIHGKQSLVTSPSATTFSVQQSSTINAAQMSGVQFLAMVRVRTNQSGVQVCSVNDGTVSTTNCVSVNNDSNWGLYKVPFIGSTTSNGIWIGATSSVTGNIYIDNAFVGAVDLKTDSVQIQTQTTKFTAGSTGAGVTLTGTPTTVGSGNFTISSGVMTSTRDINVTIACTTTNSAATHTGPTIYVNGASTGQTSNPPQITGFSAVSTWSGIVPSGQNFYCVNALNTASSGQVSVLSTNTVNSQIYSASNADTGWQDCSSTISTNSAGWGTSPTYAFQCRRSGSDLLMKGRLTVGTTPTAVEGRVGLPTWNGSQLVAAGSTIIPLIQVSGVVGYNANGATSLYSLMEPSVSYVTIGRQTSTTPSLTKMLANNFSATDVLAFGIMRIPIAGWEQSNIIIGSFNEVMTATGTTYPDIQQVFFGSGTNCTSACTTGTCSICTQVGSKITSVTWQATGNYRLNGIDGAKYSCSGTGYNSGNLAGINDKSAVSSSYVTLGFATSASATGVNVAYANAICVGSR